MDDNGNEKGYKTYTCMEIIQAAKDLKEAKGDEKVIVGKRILMLMSISLLSIILFTLCTCRSFQICQK